MTSVFTSIISSFFAMLLTLSSMMGIWQEPEIPSIEPREEVEMMEITSDYKIVTSENPSAAEQNAAEILQSYLHEISEITLPIVTDNENFDKEILVGQTNRENSVYTVDVDLGDEGVYIKTVGDTIVLTGGAKRGTLYAVYTFLEDYLDCRWFTKDLHVIPKSDSLSVQKDIDYIHIPVLEYRETDWISPRDREWSLANKLNGLVYSPLDDEIVGGGVGYTGFFAHTMQGVIIKPSDYDEFPEIKALGVISGERTNDHPCLSEEKSYEIMLGRVFELIDAYPTRQIVSVTHPDNQDYCVCDNCKAVYEEEGCPTGLMLRFVNRIADAVAERYPDRDIAIDTFAYQYTRQVPAITLPRDNVIVRLCSIECCFAHPLDDENCPENVKFVEDLKAWSEVCDRLYIWDYTTNYAHFNGPFNNWAVMQPNMKVFLENNVVGIYEEGNYQAATSNGEFGDLRSYILAKLLWDAETDVTRHMIEFCNAYYGDAGENIFKYLSLVTSRTGMTIRGQRYHMEIWERMENKGVMNLSMNEITYIDNLWAEAKALSTLNEDELLNIRRSEISWRYWKAFQHAREFNHLQYYGSAKELYNDMKELGISKLYEHSSGVLAEKPYFMDWPHRWTVGHVPDFPPGMFY